MTKEEKEKKLFELLEQLNEIVQPQFEFGGLLDMGDEIVINCSGINVKSLRYTRAYIHNSPVQNVPFIKIKKER